MKEGISSKQPHPSSGKTGTGCGNSIKTAPDEGSGYRRREFLPRVVGAAALSMVGLPLIAGKNGELDAAETKPQRAHDDSLPKSVLQRRDEAYKIRHQCAILEKDQPLALHPDNGDEAL